MEFSVPENIGDRVILENGRAGRILSIFIMGPKENVTYEIGWWYNDEYKITTFYRFEFKNAADKETKLGFKTAEGRR